jgi:hypothetical protein
LSIWRSALIQILDRKRMIKSQASCPPSVKGRDVTVLSYVPIIPPPSPQSASVWSINAQELENFISPRISLDLFQLIARFSTWKLAQVIIVSHWDLW